VILLSVLIFFLPFLIVAASLFSVSENGEYRSGSGCSQGTVITAAFTTYFFLSILSLSYALYSIRSLPEAWGLRREGFYLVLYETVFGILAVFLGIGFPEEQSLVAYLFLMIPVTYLFRAVLSLGLRTLPFMLKGSLVPEVDLHDLLNTKRGFEFFLAYCGYKFSPKNPLCWEAIDKFKKKTTYNGFCDLYTKYIDEGTPLEVNISDDLRRRMKKNYDEFTVETALSDLQSAYDEVQAELLRVMQEDSYRRFLHHTLYQKYKSGESLSPQERLGEISGRESSVQTTETTPSGGGLRGDSKTRPSAITLPRPSETSPRLSTEMTTLDPNPSSY